MKIPRTVLRHMKDPNIISLAKMQLIADHIRIVYVNKRGIHVKAILKNALGCTKRVRVIPIGATGKVAKYGTKVHIDDIISVRHACLNT